MLSEEWIHFENRCANNECSGSVFIDVTSTKHSTEPEYFKSLYDVVPDAAYIAPEEVKKKEFITCTMCKADV